MKPGIFREYDIRGIVDDDLSVDVVKRIARGFGTRLVRGGATTAAVGRDIRHSSTAFAAAMVEGLSACGLHVVDAGVVPTPLLHYTIIKRELGGGVMITGSHNPIEYNGLKLCQGTSFLYGDEIRDVHALAAGDDWAEGDGASETIDIAPDYLDDLVGRFSFEAPMRVAVDCGNGVAGPIITEVLRRSGHDMIELYTDPDGSFPNHLPDPAVPEYMQDLRAAVNEQEAQVGFGFDGDGDRLGVIDENGDMVPADWLLAAFARDLLTRHPGGKVRYDVKCADFLEDDVRAHGGVPVMGRTGHSILKRDIKELDAIIGGELSGHICFGREYYILDDPFYSAMKVLQLMAAAGGSCAALFASFPRTHSSPEIKAPTPDDRKHAIVKELAADFATEFEVVDVDGARVRFENGWGLVRASNTTPNLTIRFEANTEEALQDIARVFLGRLEKHDVIDTSYVREVLT